MFNDLSTLAFDKVCLAKACGLGCHEDGPPVNLHYKLAYSILIQQLMLLELFLVVLMSEVLRNVRFGFFPCDKAEVEGVCLHLYLDETRH